MDRDRFAEAASVGDARTPDVAEEILGWKVLAVGKEGRLCHRLDQMHPIVMPTALSSPVRHTHWPSHDWLRAICSRDSGHQPPEEGCTCGIYAAADVASAQGYLREAPLTVLARVGLAGKVIPGTRGWRAERARIVALTRTALGLRSYPGIFALVTKRYDVPVLDLDFIDRPTAQSEE